MIPLLTSAGFACFGSSLKMKQFFCPADFARAAMWRTDDIAESQINSGFKQLTINRDCCGAAARDRGHHG
jgi:hypothetical protein